MRVLEPEVCETKVDCHNCKAKLSYIYTDVQTMYDDILDKTFKYVECPMCSMKIFVKGWELS